MNDIHSLLIKELNEVIKYLKLQKIGDRIGSVYYNDGCRIAVKQMLFLLKQNPDTPNQMPIYNNVKIIEDYLLRISNLNSNSYDIYNEYYDIIMKRIDDLLNHYLNV